MVWKSQNHVKYMGLETSPHKPCVSTKKLNPGVPLMYIGLYVNDFIYFRESNAMEEQSREYFT